MGLAKALQERPHCVIIDVVLPGISGFSLCRQLRALDPQRNLSIIMVSTKNTSLDHSWVYVRARTVICPNHSPMKLLYKPSRKFLENTPYVDYSLVTMQKPGTCLTLKQVPGFFYEYVGLLVSQQSQLNLYSNLLQTGKPTRSLHLHLRITCLPA